MSDLNKHITHEVWSEILKRLPVKTLGQCRCVCKPWNSRIVSSSFIATHLKHYSQNAANTLLMYRQITGYPEEEDRYTLFLDSPESKGDKLDIHRTFTSPFMASKKVHHFRVVGSVNGLLCLSDDLFYEGHTYVVLLWNPFIHKYIKLPVPLATHNSTVGDFISMLGFGYDSKKGDHKVVRLVYIRGKDNLDTTPPMVELYSVQDGKWRWISGESVVNMCVCNMRWSQCFLNGNIHWISWERDDKTRCFLKNWLLLFDVEQEKFKKMKVPEPLSKVNTLNLSVSHYDGKLSILCSELKDNLTGRQMKRCEIWVKKEYKLGKSWCQMVNIDLEPACLNWVHCLRKSGEVLAIGDRATLVSYDPSTKQIETHGLNGRWLSWFTCDFTESLILLDKKDGVGTYDQVTKHRKKRFQYKIDPRTRAEIVKEKEVKIVPNNGTINMFYDGDYVICEQLFKFSGGKMTEEISDLLSYLEPDGISQL
ncbi:F-box/kelch-repeat protein At3g23880-like [Silene latifolia]|uniref:F-box/kelch-repeat protein At3g23880-like n=1 Tax=Silene latifolia TaxID=37657 RepID=UPI003D777143